MSEIDWGEAPDGATHYSAELDLYYRLKNQIWDYWNNSFSPPRWTECLAGTPLGGGLLPRPTKPAAPEWDGDKPDAYMCPAGCGCLWRDNGDDTMSLYGPRSQSCDVCEPLPLDRLIPVRKLRTAEQRQRDDLESIIMDARNILDAADIILSRYNLEPKP